MPPYDQSASHQQLAAGRFHRQRPTLEGLLGQLLPLRMLGSQIEHQRGRVPVRALRASELPAADDIELAIHHDRARATTPLGQRRHLGPLFRLRVEAGHVGHGEQVVGLVGLDCASMPPMR